VILGILYAIYVINCLILIFFVLLQQSKGGGLAGAFGGGGGSDTFFGYTSMQKIGHYTIYAAVLFMVLSLIIANYPHEAKTNSVAPFSDAPVGAGAAPAQNQQQVPPAEAPQAEPVSGGAPAAENPAPAGQSQ